MAEELKNDPLEDEKKEENTEEKEIKNEEEDTRFSLTISVIKNKLQIHLHDKWNKLMYHESFDSNQLKIAGFYAKQCENLEKVCNFIESARKGHHQLKLKILIEENKNDQIENGNIGIIKIIKDDDFFPMEICLNLKQIPRKKVDILEDIIKDLKNENAKLRKDLNKQNEAINKQNEENMKLRQDINKHGMPRGTIVMWSGNKFYALFQSNIYMMVIVFNFVIQTQ